MILDLLVGQQVGILVYLGLVLAATLANALTLPRLSRTPAPQVTPRLALLVPARNEARSIEACVTSLLAQDYPDLVVIALDDDSSDATGTILARLAEADPRLVVLQGRPLPAGWLGKHWACHQLAQAAAARDAAILLFTDADTVHHPATAAACVETLHQTGADLVTGICRQELGTWGERLLVPILPMAVITYVPGWMQRLRQPPAATVATIGQLMVFRREAYEAIGGHEAVRTHGTDDMALGRNLVRSGRRWWLVDATDRVTCRMYRSGREALEGFSKNFYAAFDYQPFAFAFAWGWLALVALQPFVLLALAAAGVPLWDAAVPLALLTIGLLVLQWAIGLGTLRIPPWLALLAPVVATLAALVAVRSWWLARRGTATWKGRVIPQSKSSP